MMKNWVVFYDNMHIRAGHEERVKEAQRDWAAGPILSFRWAASAARIRDLASPMICRFALLAKHRLPQSYC
jgi:hypothetical protein